MKNRFWLFKRNGVFYLQDSRTGKQESLGTREREAAERLRATKNEALNAHRILAEVALEHGDSKRALAWLREIFAAGENREWRTGP